MSEVNESSPIAARINILRSGRPMTLLAIFAALLFVYSLLSRRLDETVLTGPMLFTLAGAAVAVQVPAEVTAGLNSQIFLHLAEAGLVLLLFTEAARTDLSQLWNFRALPARLLGIGMPLTIVLGAILAWLVFPGLQVWEAAILAAILAPTDAGLGQVIVTSDRVPVPVRSALNVEAGLNDGLAVPFLLFFMALAAAGQEGVEASFARFIVEQLGYGLAVGCALGLAGGWGLGWSARRGWLSPVAGQAGLFALPVLCLIVSEKVEASMFIAAFAAGLALQAGYRESRHHSLEFSEISGQVLNLAVFFLFGMVVVRHASFLSWTALIYGALSLTVVRLLPVAAALIGMRTDRSTVLFMGWFGPRGLASIVLGLVYLEREIRLPHEAIIRDAAIATVLLSIFAHGLTARPGIALYARLSAREPQDGFPPG